MANQTNTTKKTLYFEGAGCVARADVPNCRIRTAFHLDNGIPVYLEISGMETTRCAAPVYRKFKNYGIINHLHYASSSCGDDRRDFGIDPCYAFEYTMDNILSLVNSLGASFDAVEVLPNLAGYRVHANKGGYNFGDEFRPDADLIAARQRVDSHIREKEIARGEKYPCYSLWVDEAEPAMLHYHNCRTGERFEIFVAVPQDPEQLPGLEKANAIPGCVYGFAGGAIWLQEIYRISEEYAREHELVYLDRVRTSSADCALIGSDVAAWARGC